MPRKTASVQIAFHNRYETVDNATLIGDYLAVHKNFIRDDFWTITHIPTGYSAISYIASKGDAILLARMLDANCELDFDDANDLPSSTRVILRSMIKMYRNTIEGSW